MNNTMLETLKKLKEDIQQQRSGIKYTDNNAGKVNISQVISQAIEAKHQLQNSMRI